MPSLVIGVDGGGGHTSACRMEVASGALAWAEAGPSNLHEVGLEAACDAIEKAARATGARIANNAARNEPLQEPPRRSLGSGTLRRTSPTVPPSRTRPRRRAGRA